MIIFSEFFIPYMHKYSLWLQQIAREEAKQIVRRNRLFYAKYSYPLDVILFEHPKTLGYFDPHSMQIALNKSLLNQESEVIKNILRHELAHYLTYLQYGDHCSNHGQEFRETCRKYYWDQQISKATLSIELDLVPEKLEQIATKVQKLLSLSSSSNQHEASLAIKKANDLLLKHHLEAFDFHQNHPSHFFVTRLAIRKRKDATLIAIYDILKHFMVKPVISYGPQAVGIEVIGKKIHIEVAEYVCDFLIHEIENLWQKAKQNHGLKGKTAKNNFIKGLGQGFISHIKSEHTEQQKSALIKVDNSLELAQKQFHKRLSHTSNQQRIDTSSLNIGIAAGKKMRIRTAVAHQKKKNLFIT